MVVNLSISDIILLPVLVGYTVWWSYDLRKGSRIHVSTLFLHIIIYGLAAFYIWAVSLGEIVLAGGSSSSVSWVWSLVLSGVGVVAAEAGMWYGQRRMVVERTAGGRWSYRGPVLISLFWLALYLTRFGLEDGLIGGYSVFLPPGIGPPAGVTLGTFVGVVLLVASLYLASFGFLLGITIAIRQHHRRSAGSAAGLGAPSAVPRFPVPEPGRPPSGPVVTKATTPIPESVSAPEALFCPHCGSPTYVASAFCGQCGQPISLTLLHP
jgi:hypothetical protein